jgi:deoxyribose-phosphate aldolase
MINEVHRRVELVLNATLPARLEVEKLCSQAIEQNFRSVAVSSGVLLLTQHYLGESEIKTSCRIGFPFGASDPDVKRYETELAIDAGAHEIEFIPSLAKIIDKDYPAVLREIRDVVEAADERAVKVFVGPELWPLPLLKEILQLVLDSGAQYVCASSADQVRVLRELCGPKFGILAPVDSVETAKEVVNAGANIVALPAS